MLCGGGQEIGTLVCYLKLPTVVIKTEEMVKNS